MKKSLKTSIAALSLSLICSTISAQSDLGSKANNTSKRDTLFKSYSVGIRMVNLYDLPSYRFDTDFNTDMKGLNGDKTKFDIGLDLYVEKQFTPLLGAQLGFRYGNLTGANEVEYYENTFTEVNLDLIFILSNLDALHTNSKWNYYSKLGLGTGNFTAEQFLIGDDSPDDKIEDSFWESHVGLGLQYELNSQFRLELESMYSVAFTDGFDGFNGASGSDTYLATAIGVAYTFGSKAKAPMYAINYFGEDYLDLGPVQSKPSVVLKEPEVKAENIDKLEKAIEDQARIIAKNSAYVRAQQSRIDEPRKEQVVVTQNSEQVYFDFDSSILNKEEKKEIARALETVENKQDVKIKITAYADNNGDPKYNKQLMEKRGESVKRFLVDLGYSEANVTVNVGQSKEMTQANQFLNRKVILEY